MGIGNKARKWSWKLSWGTPYELQGQKDMRCPDSKLYMRFYGERKRRENTRRAKAANSEYYSLLMWLMFSAWLSVPIRPYILPTMQDLPMSGGSGWKMVSNTLYCASGEIYARSL